MLVQMKGMGALQDRGLACLASHGVARGPNLSVVGTFAVLWAVSMQASPQLSGVSLGRTEQWETHGQLAGLVA